MYVFDIKLIHVLSKVVDYTKYLIQLKIDKQIKPEKKLILFSVAQKSSQ